MPADHDTPAAKVLAFRRPAQAACAQQTCPAQNATESPFDRERTGGNDAATAVLLASLLTLMSSFAQRAANGLVCPALAWRVERHLAELAELNEPGSLHPVLRETAEQLLADWEQLDQRLAAQREPGTAPAVCASPAARPEWLRWILGPAG
jgi:hypothetical protein